MAVHQYNNGLLQ